MCLRVMSPLFIVETPIKVWKVILESNKSMHQLFDYKPDTLYRLRKALMLEVDTSGNRYINAGFHAFTSLGKACVLANTVYGRGYKVVEFTIPKGAKCVTGNRYDIVSTSIRSGSLESINRVYVDSFWIT